MIAPLDFVENISLYREEISDVLGFDWGGEEVWEGVGRRGWSSVPWLGMGRAWLQWQEG